MSGYAHPRYAQSLREFGRPRELPRCAGWVLERQVPGADARDTRDAMGCYPLFACQDWGRLAEDLEALRGELLTLSLVADPFGAYERADLERCFDYVAPFKHHFIIELAQPAERTVSRHHRYYARKASQRVSVDVCADPRQFIDDWLRLYGMLTERHGIDGIKAFSAVAFREQLAVPGIVALRAVADGEVVGGHLWYVQGDVAYSHLAASSPRGYDLDASYALYWYALHHFRGIVRWLNLGAGAGLDPQGDDGLTRFKRGWSSDTRLAFFCGRIFDRSRYQEVVRMRGGPATSYFPAYRWGEFA